MSIKQTTMKEALRRIRVAEREARYAAEKAQNQECYAALERCQHAAFDAKALFNGARLEPESPQQSTAAFIDVQP